MARQVRLYLIRHGETVDNVAQVYAGSRDSELTNHGFQQAVRLGTHFASLGIVFTHIFSSHLQRAVKTASLIRDAQITLPGSAAAARDVLAVTKLPILMEQDFGSCEGMKFRERAVHGNQSAKEHHCQALKTSDKFVDVESKQSLAQRADAFLEEHLLPLFDNNPETINPLIAVVSHGIMLSSLWKRILLRLPERSVTLAPALMPAAPVALEHLGGWSNTGFLELHMSRAALGSAQSTFVQGATPKFITCSFPALTPGDSRSSTITVMVSTHNLAETATLPTEAVPTSHIRRLGPEWSTVILSINGKDHLKGLKRTGGGVGSSRHDTSQKTIKSFFKRRKVD